MIGRKALGDALQSLAVQFPHQLLCRRSEEHTSELQSRLHLVCRLLLEKKKNNSSLAIVPLMLTSSVILQYIWVMLCRNCRTNFYYRVGITTFALNAIDSVSRYPSLLVS